MDNQEELLTAWAAGFIDGEGVVYISKGKPSQRGVSPRYNLVVQVGCTRLEPLLRLQELFGGSICTNTNKRKPHWKPKFVWNVSALKAVSCISRVLSYLSIKREQACLGLELEQLKAIKTNSKKLALTACELRTREVIYQKVKILNERGKPKRSLQLQLKKGEQ